MRKTINLKEFGMIVKDARTARGWTQGKLAELTGFPISNICNIEKGNYNLTVGKMNKVTSVLNIYVDFKIKINDSVLSSQVV